MEKRKAQVGNLLSEGRTKPASSFDPARRVNSRDDSKVNQNIFFLHKHKLYITIYFNIWNK